MFLDDRRGSGLSLGWKVNVAGSLRTLGLLGVGRRTRSLKPWVVEQDSVADQEGCSLRMSPRVDTCDPRRSITNNRQWSPERIDIGLAIS